MGGVAVDKSSSTSRLRVGSQPTLEIGKDCVVIVVVLVVRIVPEIHVGFEGLPKFTRVKILGNVI